jgi:hypothetical protein
LIRHDDARGNERASYSHVEANLKVRLQADLKVRLYVECKVYQRQRQKLQLGRRCPSVL